MPVSPNDGPPSLEKHGTTGTRGRVIAVLAIALSAFAGGSALVAAAMVPDSTPPQSASPRTAAEESLTSTTVAASPPIREVPTQRHRYTEVPILMYHVIGDPPPSAPHPELYVGVADFAGQMLWLEQNGYSAVTLHAVWSHWEENGELPARPVVITFDDGTRSIAVSAKPVLAAHDWPGVLNLDLSNLDPPWGLSPHRVHALIEGGWEINSHTLTHPDLTRLDATHLQLEVAGSRTALQRRFHVPADFFCYPSGRFDERVIGAVKAAGYLGATTTIDGLAHADSPYTLARVRVNRSDGQRGFAAKMAALSRRP